MNPDDAQIESDRGDEHMDNVSYALTQEGRLQVVNDRLLAMAKHVEVLAAQVELLTSVCVSQQEMVSAHSATIDSLIQAGYIVKNTLDAHTAGIKAINQWLTRSG